MGQDAVKLIVQSILQRKQQNEEQRHNIASENENQQRILNEKDRLNNESRQFDVNYKLTKSLHDIEMLEKEQAIGTNAAQGVPTPGVDLNKPLSTRTDDNGDTYHTHQLPINDESTGKPLTMEIPSPETFARQQAARNLAIHLPEIKATHDAKMAEIEEGKNADLIKTKAAKDADLERADVNKTNDYNRAMDVEKLRASNELAVHKADNDSKELIERYKQMGVDADYDTSPYTKGLINGDLTVNEVKKFIPSKHIQAALFNSISKAGFNFYTDKQKADQADLAPAVGVLKYIDQFIAAQPNLGTGNKITSSVVGAANLFNPDLTVPEQEITGSRNLLAKVMSKDTGRIGQQEEQAVLGKFAPSKYATKAANIKKRNDFVDELNNMVDSKFSTLAPGQRQMIKDQIGLSKITKLDEKTGLPVDRLSEGTSAQANRNVSDADMDKDLEQFGIKAKK